MLYPAHAFRHCLAMALAVFTGNSDLMGRVQVIVAQG
jgi:hypothetical protein